MYWKFIFIFTLTYPVQCFYVSNSTVAVRILLQCKSRPVVSGDAAVPRRFEYNNDYVKLNTKFKNHRI